MRKTIVMLVLACGLVAPSFTQVAETKRLANLELQLETEDLQQGVPQAFTFLLVNKTNHEVRVPYIPNVDCDGTLYGGMWLRVVAPGGQGWSRGCGVNALHGESILDRAKRWRVLLPGASLNFKAGKERALYNDQVDGTYEFWAHYDPPTISPSDQEVLRRAGIDFPQGPLDSAHVRFEKKR